jgi:3-oxoacyl-[acyl-carrier protein] reductase
MGDYLLTLGRNPAARAVLGGLGVPVPRALRRTHSGFLAQPLAGLTAWAGGDGVGASARLEALGAAVVSGEEPVDVLLCDATGLDAPAALRAVYDGLHPRIRGLKACGRVVVLGRPEASAPTAAAASCRAALDGFARSVAKEVGRKGATANLVWVDEGAEAHLDGVLRFLGTAHSVYVSGQPLHVTARLGPEPVAFTERSLDGKVALVTGAARGIGAATAERLAREGAVVVLLDREDALEPLDRVAKAVGGHVLTCDVTASDAPARVAARLSELGGVDVVVHNAGVTRDRTLGRMPPEDWDLVLDVNLAAILRLHDGLLAGPLRDGAGSSCCRPPWGSPGTWDRATTRRPRRRWRAWPAAWGASSRRGGSGRSRWRRASSRRG